jgi:branched-chain amino acid transport system ATP-binding protein
MSAANDMLLDVRGLEAGYGATRVLFGIDLQVRAGSVTALLGANGAGKTSTLRALCGLIRGVAHVPDGRGTFTGLTTEENLRMGACTRRDKAGVRADFERFYEYFPRLHERRHQQAGTLSGGEQQMLAIARALMLRPRLLLMDEPSFGLAPKVVQDIFRIMQRVRSEQQVTILLVEQNASLALDLADHA